MPEGGLVSRRVAFDGFGGFDGFEGFGGSLSIPNTISQWPWTNRHGNTPLYTTDGFDSFRGFDGFGGFDVATHPPQITPSPSQRSGLSLKKQSKQT